jgi:hypothetical protein
MVILVKKGEKMVTLGAGVGAQVPSKNKALSLNSSTIKIIITVVIINHDSSKAEFIDTEGWLTNRMDSIIPFSF